jgi:glycosyltransferase involved in cell wall biosynthesis
VGWREQWSLPRLARRLRLDLVHYPTNTMPWKPLVPSVATLHDTMAIQPHASPPSMRNRLIRSYEGFAVRKTLRNARLVITGTDTVADDLVAAGLPANRVRMIRHGLREDVWRRPNPSAIDEFCDRQGLARPYLLTMTSADRRKNAGMAIEAFAQRMHQYPTLTLVVLLAASDLRRELDETVATSGAGARVRFLERLPAADMPALYAGASAMLFLSLREGFGLPPLESMACGTPVICSNRPPMTTLYGDSVLLVEPTDPDAVAGAIDRVMMDQALRAELVTRGRQTVAQFSWDRAARDTIGVYEEAIALS